MFGTVHFIDGHTEPIIIYNFNPTQTELYFTTVSGKYGFKRHVNSQTYDIAFTTQQPLSINNYSFYKYNDYHEKWFVTTEIDYAEIYTEVLPNG
jgi:hypothetical protein